MGALGTVDGSEGVEQALVKMTASETQHRRVPDKEGRWFRLELGAF